MADESPQAKPGCLVLGVVFTAEAVVTDGPYVPPADEENEK